MELDFLFHTIAKGEKIVTESQPTGDERPTADTSTAPETELPTSNDRWLGALCYFSIFVLVPIFAVRDKSTFLAGHCRQGLLLLFIEFVLYQFLKIVDASIGLIPILGLLITVVLHLAVWLTCLVLSVLGVIKALSGEEYRLPLVDHYADRIPIK